MKFLLQLVVFLKLVTANDHCKEGKCQTYALDIYGDAVENSEFVDHDFHKFPTTNTDSHLHMSCGNELGLSLETCEKHDQQTLSSLQHLRRYRGHKFDTFLLCNGH